MTMTLRTATAAAALLAAASAQAAPGRSLGAWASREAARAGLQRVAVLPFTSLDGSPAAEGRRLAEDVTTELAGKGRVQVVERGFLNMVMEEHALGLTGALDPRGLARVGALSQAQAVVVGSFVTLGNTIAVDARLVLVETGVAVAARRAEGRRDWYPADVIPEPAPITPDEAVADVYQDRTGRPYRPRAAAPRPAPRPMPLLARAPELRDAPADPCVNAEARVNALQEGILELKARYWAGQARRKGFSAAALRSKPADTIPDAGLRRRFMDLMAECPADDSPLSFEEVRRFVSADQRSFELLAACRPAGR